MKIGLGNANQKGQVLLEYVLLMAIFVLLIAKIAPQIPATFSQASPYLGGKIEQRLETGNGFSSNAWQKPVGAAKGGVKD